MLDVRIWVGVRVEICVMVKIWVRELVSARVTVG